MKKMLSLLLVLVLVAGCFAGCNGRKTDSKIIGVCMALTLKTLLFGVSLPVLICR